MDDNINPIQRGINHSALNQRFLASIGEEAIQSMAKIIKDVADSLQISEEIVVQKIKNLKGQQFSGLKDLERLIFNTLLKNENTWNYVEDFAKEKSKHVKKEKPNQIFLK